MKFMRILYLFVKDIITSAPLGVKALVKESSSKKTAARYRLPFFPRHLAQKNLGSKRASFSLVGKLSEHVPRRERNAVVKVKVHSPADDDREQRDGDSADRDSGEDERVSP